MMRSNMPEQLHRGIGSLSEVARGMFRGGEVQGFQLGGAVGGHPLDQYGQYLNQTYAEPIQRLAADAVNQFVDSVRQKEQAYFGGSTGSPMQGGLMGSPMQGGLMGSSANPGSTLAVGGLSPTMGQVGSLSGNPLQAVMQSGTFDAQVAAAAKTPSMPSYMISQPVTSNGPPTDPSFYAMQQPGGMRGFPVKDPFTERRRMLYEGPMSTAMPAVMQSGTFDAPPPSSSPFGNSLGNQQMMGQRRLEERPTINVTGQNPFGVPLSTDNALSRLSTQRATEAFSSLFSTGQRPSLNPLVERQGIV